LLDLKRLRIGYKVFIKSYKKILNAGNFQVIAGQKEHESQTLLGIGRALEPISQTEVFPVY
jgi:hypothetical protein